MSGIPGAKPLPKQLRLLKNDKAHAHRYVGKEEPDPSNTSPLAPEYLSERATEIFNDFVCRVEEMYPVSETDMDILVLYANNKEQLESYELFLRTEGSTVTTDTRYGTSVKARPEIPMLKECKSLQLNILREFGLSPSSRSRIDLSKGKKKKDKTNKFAKKKTA